MDQEVQKCLLDIFKTFNSEQTDQLAPESQGKLTFRQRLRRDKERLLNHDADAPAVGKRYYQVLRDAYQDMSSPSKRLKPDEDQDSQGSIDQTLKDACLGISGSPVDIGPMTDCVCSGSKELTQIEIVPFPCVCIDAFTELAKRKPGCEICVWCSEHLSEHLPGQELQL